MLLVSCYALGHQPLTLATAQAALLDAGVPVEVVDTSLQPLEPTTARAHPCVAISVPMHTALRLGVALAQALRAQGYDGLLVFFGLYAPLNAPHIFASGGDVVLGPDAVDALVDVARAAPSGRAAALQTLANHPGVWLSGKQAPALQPPRPHISRVERRGLSPLAQYTALTEGRDRRVVGYVETTHGCKHTCRHCPITPVYQGRFYAVDRDVVLNDVDALVASGAQHITFGDPDFLNGPSHALRITHALHERHPHVSWDATIKVEHLLQHAELLPVFKQRNCAFIVSAVESLSNTVLEQLAKGHTASDVDRALSLVEGAGITLRPTFVPFTPWTTAQDLLHLAAWLEDHNLDAAVDPVQLAVRLLIPPGSALLSSHAGASWLGPLDPAALTHTWTHPDARLDVLCRTLGQLAADAAQRGDDPVNTLHTLLDVLRLQLGAPARRHQPSGRTAPRLTEHWFC